MKHLRHIFFLAVLLQFSSFANASMIYATDIDWANNGTIGGANDRNNPNNALGEADGAFTAIGLGGFSVFSFGEEFQSKLHVAYKELEEQLSQALEHEADFDYESGLESLTHVDSRLFETPNPSQEMPKWAMRDSSGSRITL